MKYTIILMLLLSSCQIQEEQKKQEQITEEEKQIAKNLIQGAFDDLWAGLEIAKIDEYHTNDFIILEQGEVWDNERVKVYMRKQLSKTARPKRTNRMEYITIDKYGESMQITYYNYAEFKRTDTIVGKAKWLESALAIKTKNGWRLKMMHSTGVAIK